MKIKIFENKKLFGKINIFDIILLVIVLIAAVVAYMFLGNKDNVTTNSVEKKYSIKVEKLPLGTTDKIKVGDKVYDNEINTFIGEVVSVEKKDYTRVVENHQTNEFVLAKVEGFENAIVTIKVSLNDLGSDLKTNNDYVIKVGKKVCLRGPDYAGTGYITYIER